LNVPIWTVNNVVHKHGRARKPRGKAETVSPAAAPVEAWQQALLPKLEEIADEACLDDGMRRAFVFVVLLGCKPYTALPILKRGCAR
jgi:hypothetical protein